MCEKKSDESSVYYLNGIPFKEIGVLDDGGVLFTNEELRMDRVLRPEKQQKKPCNCENCTCKTKEKV